MRTLRSTVLKVAGAVVAILLWWLTSAASTNPYYPPLGRVLESVHTYWVTGPGQEDFSSSMRNFGAGLGLAIVLGVLVGLVVGQNRTLDQALSPSFEFVRAIPATALLPFAMLIFGLGTGMKTFIIALGCFFPILLNVIDGCRGLAPTLHDTTRTFGITGLFRQVFVVVPATAARTAAGIRIAIPLGLILVVTSEMTGSNQGIGYVLNNAQNSFNLVAVWSAVLILGVLGVVLNLIFGAVERRGLRWYFDQQGRP